MGFEPTTRGLKVPCSAAELPAPRLMLIPRLDRTRTGNLMGPRFKPHTAPGRIILVGGVDGLYRSDDAGASWRQILQSKPVLALAMVGDGSTIAAVDRDTFFYGGRGESSRDPFHGWTIRW